MSKDVTYEVLKVKGRPHEKGRMGPGQSGNLLVIKYKGERPPQYADYEAVFKGDPFEMMDWLEVRQAAWGLKLEKKAKPRPETIRLVSSMDTETRPEVETVSPKETKAWRWAVAVGAVAAAAAAAHFSGVLG